MQTDTVYDILMSESLAPAAIGIVAAVLFLLAFIRNAGKRARRRKYLHSPLFRIDQMEGAEFEGFLAAYFEDRGYRVTLTGGRGDYGGDLFLKKDGIKTVVQVKRHRSRVGIGAIQEVLGAKAYYHADECLVATNSWFTAAARDLAKSAGVGLWDRKDLLELKAAQGWEG